MTATVDWLELVLHANREEFVASCPFPLLVGQSPRLPAASESSVDSFDESTWASAEPALEQASVPPHARILAVRKVKDNFASMITVGRTANNDLVLLDPRVSRFHAYFQTVEQGLELVDASSKYGTFVDGRKLVAKQGERVLPDQTIRFGDQTFTLLTAEACWNLLHRVIKPRG